MPDIFGASGQFSIGALGDQNQAALNNAYGSGGFGGTVGQYAPYPSFGEQSGPVAQPVQQGGGGGVWSGGAAPFNGYGAGGGGGGGGGMGAWGGMTYLPNGQIDQNNPANIALFNSIMGVPNNPSPQGLLGYDPGAGVQNGFGYPGAMPPSQMFNPSLYAPQANPFAFRAGLSMNPYLSLGWPGPQTQPSIDPQFDRSPYGVLGNEGTRDFNVENPETRPNLFYDPNLNDDAATKQRDAIAQQLLTQSAQAARS